MDPDIGCVQLGQKLGEFVTVWKAALAQWELRGKPPAPFRRLSEQGWMEKPTWETTMFF